MTALPQTTTDACAGGCGREVTRELAQGGRFAHVLNRLPLLCNDCEARQAVELEAEQTQRAARQLAIERRGRHAHSGLPPALAHVDLDRLDAAGCETAIDMARSWAAREICGLLLTGPFGTGKTTIAAGALRHLLERDAGRWVSAPELMAKLGAGFGTEQREWALDLLTARRALVLDDLDKTRPSEYGAEQIFLAVDNAVTRGQRLLVTTNLTVSGLATKWPEPYGEAIASRLAGYCTAISVTGRDRRLGGGQR